MHNENELISVIVPVYKVERYLKECVDSILAQSYTPMEIIIVDDGSPDSCPAICDEYAARFEHIRVLHKTNGGLSDARNAGLEAARGTWLAFIDSDDFIAPDFIASLYHAAQSAGTKLAVAGFDYVDEAGRTLEKNKNTALFSCPVLTEEKFWREHAIGCGIACTVAWSKLYQRSLFGTVRFEKGRLHEDEFILHHIVSQCPSIATVSRPLYFYRQRGGSIMAGASERLNFDAMTAFLERYDYLMEKGYQTAAEGTLIGAMNNLSGQRDIAAAIIEKRYRALLPRLSQRQVASLSMRLRKFLFLRGLFCYGLARKAFDRLKSVLKKSSAIRRMVAKRRARQVKG